MDRFENHVGTILCEPETTIDMPFKQDLEARTEAHGQTISKQIRLKATLHNKRSSLKNRIKHAPRDMSLNLLVPKDTHTFKLAQPNVFTKHSDKEFFVLHHREKQNQIKLWSEREKKMGEIT